MKRNFCFVIIAMFFAFGSQAQISEGSKVGMNTGRGLNAMRYDSFLTSPSASNVTGDFYADSTWQIGGVRFSKPVPQIGGGESDSLAGIKIRYNVLNNELEVLADERKKDVRVIRGGLLKGFSVNPENPVSYVNMGTFKSDKPVTGFGEILSSGKIAFVKHYKTRITKPNYNPGFAAGEKNTIVRIEHDYYVISDGTARSADLGKKVTDLFVNKKQEAEAFVKTNDLNLKKEGDVIRLFEFVNGK